MMVSDQIAAAPIRLALASTGLRPGGAERTLANLALGLDRTLFSPQVYVLARAPAKHESQLVESLAQADVPVHFLGARHKGQLLGTVRKLRAALARQSPDIVQAFLFHANVASALAADWRRVPVFAGLRVAQPQALRRFVERRLARRFRAFVCVSQAVADHAAEQGRLPREKLFVIPNGIDLDALQNVTPIDWSALGIAPNRRVILFIGRLDAQKGADLLIDAAARFLPAMPEHVVVIVGDGPQQPQLLQAVQRRGLQHRICFTPWRDDAARCIAAAEIVVLPSRYEGMSNVLLEAMALRKPVVATQVEGVAEVLGPLAGHQACPPNDASALAAAVTKLASDRAMQQTLGHANNARVAQHFTLSRMGDAYTELYLHTLGRA